MRVVRRKGDKRKELIVFVKQNPFTTYKEIRKKLKIHPERYFKSMKNIFEEAGLKSPRTFKRNTKQENKRLIVNFIKKNPGIGGHTITRKLKRNPHNFFKNIREAYKEAGVDYIKYRPSYKSKKFKEAKKKQIIELVKKNPFIKASEIESKLNIKLLNFFKNFEGIYEIAGMRKMSQGERIRNRKKERVINFIKQNPLATQREINRFCKTHVQDLFKKGIFEAYKKAKIKFPYERLKLYGTALKNIKKRARNFENKVAVNLSGYGNVNRLIKTKREFADIIFERKGKRIVVEVKDYKSKEISISQIRQLNKYLEDCNCNLGILVCHNKPKKDRFLIGKNKVFILEKQEIDRIPKILG